MPNTVTIEVLAAGLNLRTQEISGTISSTMRNKLEFELELPVVTTDYSYTGEDVEVGDLIQGYQPQFTPRGAMTHDGVLSILRPIKIDRLFSAAELEKFFSRQRPQRFQMDPERIRAGYVGEMYDVMTSKWIEELNRLSWAGDYVAPTAGTPGPMINAVDGYKEAIAGHITDGRLVPINTGAFVANTMVAQIRAFCDDIPQPYQRAPGTIYMSWTLAQMYADDYAAKFPSREVNEVRHDQKYLRVDHYNKVIKPMVSMEGSSRIVVQFDDAMGMIVGTRAGMPRFFDFRFEAEDRNLKMFAEIHRFFNFETCLHTFVNDQA